MFVFLSILHADSLIKQFGVNAFFRPSVQVNPDVNVTFHQAFIKDHTTNVWHDETPLS